MNLKDLADGKAGQIDLRLFLGRAHKRGLCGLVALLMLGSLGKPLLPIDPKTERFTGKHAAPAAKKR
jgi:hypothetical protein